MLAVAATAASAPATAAPPSAAASTTTSTGQQRLLAAATTAPQQRAVTTYWTPERMRSAAPVDTLSLPRRTRGFVPTPRAETITAAPFSLDRARRAFSPQAQTRAVPWTGGGAVAAVTGKIFFVRDGGRFVCSGSSVRSGNRSTVVTAGHCLTEKREDGTPADSTQVVFVPGYTDGRTPHGTWPVTFLAPAAQWRNGDQASPEASNLDVAFAVVAPRADGKRLADVVGSFPIAFDAPTGRRVSVFGYPSAPPYDGERLHHCRAASFPDDTPRSTDEGVSCFMTGGSSGGPWLSGFDGSTGAVTSVVSFSYEDSPDVLYGPRFGAVVRELYGTAERR
ncbi:peptidase [Kineococcus sp. NUM-3379]